MKEELIKNLYPMNRCLLGQGYDNALHYIDHLIGLETIGVPSGTKLGTWTVPDEWIVRDAWVSFNGEKIIDYKENPLSLIVGSLPFSGKVDLLELKKHLNYDDQLIHDHLYEFKYYEKDWGFCMPKKKIWEPIPEDEQVPDPSINVDGKDYVPKLRSLLQEGEYEVFIDTEYIPGKMKLGVHTIPGKSDREILLFAHLDHPYQANDNLSGVAALVDLAKRLKSKRTIKIIFCPETVGSIAYGMTQDISKVDFVLAVDICGNKNTILLQKSFDPEARINRVAHCALMGLGETYRKGMFRNTIGSDEYIFNDPLVNIPGILLSTWPYPEYHTSADTPEIIDYDMIEKTEKVVERIIEIWDKDYIPKRNVQGPLMRSKYGIQTGSKEVNLSWDYFWYSIDGKKTLAELVCEYGLNFSYVYEKMDLMAKDKVITKTKIK